MKPISSGLNSVVQSHLVQLVRATYHSYRRTNCSQMAAGVALFGMLSLLPLIVLLVSALAPAARSINSGFDIRREVLHFARITVSPVARQWLADVMQSVTHSSIVIDVFTLLAFGWAALNAFSQLDASFHRIWHDGNIALNATWRELMWEQIRRRRNALALLLLVVAGVIGTSLIGRWAMDWETTIASNLSIAQSIVTSLGAWVEAGIFLALLYRWLLPERVRWRSIGIGAIIASGANVLVTVFVASFVDTTIGATNVAIGGPLSIMLGAYLFSQNVLIGCILVRQSTLIFK